MPVLLCWSSYHILLVSDLCHDSFPPTYSNFLVGRTKTSGFFYSFEFLIQSQGLKKTFIKLIDHYSFFKRTYNDLRIVYILVQITLRKGCKKESPHFFGLI